MDLLWFTGIGWDTPIRQIGWTYVVMAGLVIALVRVILRDTRHERRD